MSDLLGEGLGFNVGAFAAKAIDEGMSSNAFRAALRDEGVTMSNQSMRSIYNQVRDAVAGRDVIANLPYDALPPSEAYTDWAAGAEGRYATFVQSFTRMPGERELEPKFFQYVTDEPHTPQEAIDAAAAHYTSDATSTGGTPKGSYISSVVTSMTRTIGRP